MCRAKAPGIAQFYIFFTITTTLQTLMTDEQREPKLSDSFGKTIEANIPEDVEWIDDVFYIKETRFGLFTSILKEPLGQHFITGATKDGVLSVTRAHLKALQDGTMRSITKVVHSGFVGGKL